MGWSAAQVVYVQRQSVLHKSAGSLADYLVPYAVGSTGVRAVSSALPMITGRTPYYHGTTVDAAQRILQEGILPANRLGGRPTLTSILNPEIIEKGRSLSYMTPNKLLARGYASQADVLAPILKELEGKDPQAVRGKLDSVIGGLVKDPGFQFRKLFRRKGVVKGSIPLWSKEIAEKVVRNPEAMGSLDAFKESLGLGILGMSDSQLKQVRKIYLKDLTMEGGVPARYIKGSPLYKRLSFKELRDYIKADPKRFAKGLGLGLLGAGGVSLAIYLLIRNLSKKKRKKEVRASMQYEGVKMCPALHRQLIS